MDKNGILTITDFQKGIAKSPVLGNGHIVNADIFETQGLLKLNKKIVDNTWDSTPTIDSLPVAFLKLPEYSNQMILLDNGKLIGTSGGLFGDYFSQGFDLVEWNGYLLASGYSGTEGIIRIGQLNTSGSQETLSGWTVAITGLANAPIYFCKGKDGYLYFTNGYKIGRITAISIPSTVCVATYSDNVLDLPQEEEAVSIVELGSKLLIGTQSSKINPKYITQANIYPWDMVSSSYSLPVSIHENGINTMISKDNLVYVSAGLNGNIYVTNGTSYRLFTTLKTSKKDRYGSTSYVNKNAISFNKQGRLLIGTSTFSDSTPNTTTYQGVWEIDISTGDNHLAYTVPSGEYGQTHSIEIGYIYSYNEAISFGYKDNTTYNTCASNDRLQSLCSFESNLFITGDYQNKKTFNELQWLFVKPLQTGQSIKIYYRNGLEDTWTLIHTSTSDHVGKYSTIDKAKIANSEVIQIKIELLNTDNSVLVSPELIRVFIK